MVLDFRGVCVYLDAHMTIPNRQLVATKPPTEKPEKNKQFGFFPKKNRKYIYIWPDMWIIAVPKKMKKSLSMIVFGITESPAKGALMKKTCPLRILTPPMETPLTLLMTPKRGLKTGGCFDTLSPTSQGFLGPGFFS